MNLFIRSLLAFVVCLLVSLLTASVAVAQPGSLDAGTGGTSYIIAYPDTTQNTYDTRFPKSWYQTKLSIYVYSPVANTLSIRGNGYSRLDTPLAARRFTHIDLSSGKDASLRSIVDTSCTASKNTFRLDAESPIVVICVMVTPWGSEAFTPLPISHLGTEYHVASMPGEVGSDISAGGTFDFNRRNKMFSANILVVAPFDETRVTIVPNGQVLRFCPAQNIALNAGEAFQIQSWVDTLTANVGGDQPDFGGSRIFSTKPIAVITGNTRAQVRLDRRGLGGNVFKNSMIEWMSPTTHSGVEFVYLPTWDSRRPANQQDTAEKRQFESVRVYGQSETPTTLRYITRGREHRVGSVEFAKFQQVSLFPNEAAVFYTDRPAAAFMSSSAAVKYGGLIDGPGGYDGGTYYGWGPHMVRLTPRHQWVGFAPVIAPNHPTGMEHILHLVTDSLHREDVYLSDGSRFVFDRPIGGTKMWWGTRSLQSGTETWVEGRYGAKFAGYVSGLFTAGGKEEYRPGGTPSQYEEHAGVTYSYPLTSRHVTVYEVDSVGFDASRTSCTEARIVIAPKSQVNRIRAITLDSAINARIISMVPATVSNETSVTVTVGPVDPTRSASGVLRVKTLGLEHFHGFQYVSTPLLANPGSQVPFGHTARGQKLVRTVTLTNQRTDSLDIVRVGVVRGVTAFAIENAASFPRTIAPGQTVDLTLSANPPTSDEFADSVEIVHTCGRIALALTVDATEPCAQVNDLDFGHVDSVGQSVRRAFTVCNAGGGTIRFSNPNGDSVISWTDPSFAVSREDMNRLKAAALNKTDCLTMWVTFTARRLGPVRATTRIHPVGSFCSDSVYWTANVGPTSGEGDELERVRSATLTVQPNPTGGDAVIQYLASKRGQLRLTILNDRGEVVAVVVDGEVEPGVVVTRWLTDGVPAGVYYCSATLDDERQAIPVVVLK